MKRRTLTLLVVCAFSSVVLQAAAKTDAALLMLQAPTARAAALGEAFSMGRDDIGAFHYNPASIASLKRGDASLLYKKGLSDDALGHIDIGLPTESLAWGLSAAYYDAGRVNVFDGVTSKTISAQKDYLLGLGVGRQSDVVSWGIKGQYFYSNLAEQQTAQTGTIDFGMTSRISQKIMVGAAIQNIGPALRYSNNVEEELPRTIRAGMSALLIPTQYVTTLFIDAPYSLTRHELNPAVGIELGIGPLAFRTGYKAGRSQEELTVGMGFSWQSASLDYAFGLANKLDSTQQVSLSYRFDVPKYAGLRNYEKAKPEEKEEPKPETKKAPTEIQQQIIVIPPPPPPSFEVQPLGGNTSATQSSVYTVREGETLQSIAKREYGYEGGWQRIYMANKHIMKNPDDLKPGQKILIPKGWK